MTTQILNSLRTEIPKGCIMELKPLKVGDFAGFVDKPTPRVERFASLWYLLRVHPNRENSVRKAIEKRGMDCYLPMYPRTVKVNQRTKRVVNSALFPGLIFMPDYDANFYRLRTIEGVSGFLRFGEFPACARAIDMLDIKNLEVLLSVPVSKRPRLYATGQLVKITDGPFQGFAGRIERLDDNGRVRILLATLARGVSATVPETQIEPVEPSTKARTDRRPDSRLRQP